MDLTLLWIPATIAAAGLQTARNLMQHRLTEVLGTAGATQVRFLYGLPFALLLLALVCAAQGAPPTPTWAFLGFVAAGAVAQILATALMLAAMRRRSFAVVTAFTKTEPLQVAVFGLVILGDRLGIGGLAAVVVATFGIVLLSWQPGAATTGSTAAAAIAGIASGACFAVAAIGFRGAILSLPDAGFLLRATTTLAWGLGLQTTILLVWLALFDPSAIGGSLRVWRSSLFAGAMGALASQCWFIGFALTVAANVRTLGLVEVLFAMLVSRRLLEQSIGRREAVGLALIVAGVGALLIRAIRG